MDDIGKIINSEHILWMIDAAFLSYTNLQIMFLSTCLLGCYPIALRNCHLHKFANLMKELSDEDLFTCLFAAVHNTHYHCK